MKSAKALVLVISPQDKVFVEKTVNGLRTALGASAPELEVHHVLDVKQAVAALSRERTPHVALIDAPELTESARNTLKPVLQGLRDLDSACCVLLLSKTLPDAHETMAWLDQGATGVLQRDFQPSQVADALKEALQRRLSAHLARTAARIPARHKIRIQLASLEQALVAETLNVGTGGMFVRVVPQDIATGETVEFEFVVSSQVSAGAGASGAESEPLILKMDANASAPKGSITAARGTGIVRWIRPTASKGLPEGIGVQFSELDAATQRWIDAFVATHHVRAFIPKS